MRFIVVVGLVAVALGAPGRVACQRIEPPRFPPPKDLWPFAYAVRATSLAADSQYRKIPPTHWQNGAIVGAAAMALLTFGFAHGLCRFEGDSQRNNCVGVALIAAPFGGVVGAGLGALIGGQFPKKARARNHLWEGAIISGVVLAALSVAHFRDEWFEDAAIGGGFGVALGAIVGASIAKHDNVSPADSAP